MRKCLIIFLPLLNTALVFITAKGQNLVPNSSFERIKKQPCRYLIYNRADSLVENLSEYFYDWYTPTGGSSDIWYFSDTITTECSRNTKSIGIKPHSGRFTAGIYSTAATIRQVLIPPVYREYLQVRLKRPLVKGVVYRAGFYAYVDPRAGDGSNNLGMFFSTLPPVRIERGPYGQRLIAQPQVNESAVLNDPKQWYKVEGCFTAREAYEYLTIGNFFDDVQTKLRPVPGGILGGQPYYLIDDVFVEVSGVDILPQIALGNDTTLCPGKSIQYHFPNLPGVTYTWQDGSEQSSYRVTQTGTYTVSAQISRCVVRDTVRINVEKPVVLSPDTIICRGEALTLKPAHPDSQYVWNDGSRDSVLVVNQAGVYSVRIPSTGCPLADTVRVDVVDCPGFVPNVITPNGDGKNEVFVIDNLEHSPPWQLRVFNRWGVPVYTANPYRNTWTGEHLPAGTYYYELTNQVLKRTLKGWVEVLR
jgi:gliding motility-associated-like protein